MKLRVFASLAEDINNGWLWIPESIISERSVVRIGNRESGRVVYCEALQIGENYRKRYDNSEHTGNILDKDSSITMSEWYRKKLGIEKTQIEIDIDIAKADHFFGHLMASLDNPQIVVRLATKLAILSVVLGVAGIWLGLKTAT